MHFSKQSMFLKLYVIDKMQYNTFIRDSKFTTENMQFSRLSQRRGLIIITMASYWLWH